ncbi:MAG: hypothetical protein OEU54_15285 [Gemmatimonadota bacterium]|nr:hypothetical protein [Gemmatimonadota bacterium]
MNLMIRMIRSAGRPRLRTSLAAGISTLLIAPLAFYAAGDGEGLTPAQEADANWPYEIEVPDGRLTIFQPQPEEFVGNRLTARTAVGAVPAGSETQVFGAIWMTARVETDQDDRVVIIQDVTVDRVRFPNATDEQLDRVAEIIEDAVPDDMVISLDRLLTSLELVEREREAVANLNNDPPVIEFRSQPAALVLIDGEPRVTQIQGSTLMRVVNTAFTILLDPRADTYWLYAGGDFWYTSAEIAGPWRVAPTVPSPVRELQPPEPEADEYGDPLAQGGNNDTPPLIVVATEPTELISTTGEPEFVRLDDTGLLSLDNTDSFVFMELESQRFFLLISGRWYRTASLENGPWTFMPADEIPEGFQRIDPSSDAGAVLASVAGTDEALDAVLDAQVPQTAAVSREATVTATFDGDPQFEPIEGTEMTYAVNTEYQIVEVGGHYYLCHAGTWFESDEADGEYAVATEIPNDIYDIPPDSPVFNVRYVHIYETTVDTVFVGYTSGYTHSFVHHQTVVWGTGWRWTPWVGVWFIPRPWTWGFHWHWNPWVGWSTGWSMGFGRFHFSVGWGTWWRGPGWWGPRGFWAGARRGAFHGYRAGFRAGYRAGQRSRNMYRTQQFARSDARDRAANIRAREGGNVARPGVERPGAGDRARPQNNVLADRDGNVFRRNDQGGFDQRRDGQWENRPDLSNRAGQGNLQDRAGNRPNQANRPSTGNLNRPSTGQANRPDQRSQLQRGQQSRDRGSARTQNFNRSRPTGRAGASRARRPIDF